MDTTTIVLGGILLVVAIAAALYMLNRSWGDFGRSSRLPPTGTSAPGRSPEPPLRTDNNAWDLPERLAMPDNAPASVAADTGSDLVPIANPLVRRSAEQALSRGGPPTRYIVQRDGMLYFDFSQIDDATKRQRARELMLDLNAGRNVDIRSMMLLVREIFSQP